MNELVFRNANGVPMTTSQLVAETFKKPHFQVLRDIDNLECSDCFRESNFVFSFKIREIANGGHKEERYCNLTKDGFTFLAMGYTGKKAAEFKEKYIAAFNAMERTIQQGAQLSQQFMETQMQMMGQMMNLCNTMMQRIERMEAVQKPQTVQQEAKPQPQPVLPPTKYGRYVMNTYDVRMFYPSFVKVYDAAATLRTRGLAVYQTSLYAYLRKKGYICIAPDRHNRPSAQCEENGWMVSTWAGDRKHSGRKCFVPYLSPSFVDMLENEIREDVNGTSAPSLFTQGKEVAE